MLTLYSAPVIYLLMDRLRSGVGKGKRSLAPRLRSRPSGTEWNLRVPVDG